MTLSEFINRVRSLYNIDRYRLPELSDAEWPLFRDNPPGYFIKTDRRQAEAIFREVEARQVVPAKPDLVLTRPKRHKC
jgi:hypothetical protein